jgi:type I restriction enzyme S subunit
VVGSEAHGCLVTNDFPIFRSTEDLLLPQFISLVFHLSSFQRAAAALATGTTERRRLKEDAFLSISIVLPSLRMQRRIVDLIGAVDDTIKAADEGGRRAASCLQVLCDELGRTTDTAVPLGSLGSTVTGRTPATAVERYWLEPTVNFFTPADLGDALEVTNATRKVSAAGAEEVRRLPKYSVAQVCIGATLGKVSVLPLGGTANQQVNALTGLSELDSVALALVLRSRLVQSNVVGASGQTTLPILSKSAWSSMSVPWPPAEQRERYALLGRAVEAARCNTREVVASLGRVRSALLSELMSGERTIPDSYDKPSSAGA